LIWINKMKNKYWKRSLLLVFFLFMNACEKVDTISNSPSSTQDRYQLSTPMPSDILDLTPISSVPPWSNLKCTIIMETEWGSGTGEFGNNEWVIFQSIVITDNEEIYISDPANGRFIKFKNEEYEPININLPDEYRNLGFSWFYADDINIYIMIEDRDVLILSSEGEFQAYIDLEMYEPFRPWGKILADGHGGFFLLLLEAKAFFTANFKLIHYIDSSNVKVIEIDPSLVGESLQALIIGRDQRLYSHDKDGNIYDWGMSAHPDFNSMNLISIEPITSNIEIDGYHNIDISLVSVDHNTHFYSLIMDLSDEYNRWLVGLIKFSDNMEILNAGFVPDEWRESINTLSSKIAPDGSLFALAYDLSNPSDNPKIIRCTFPDSE
jgi:hypothetical protein